MSTSQLHELDEPTSGRRRRGAPVRPSTIAVFGLLFAALMFASHAWLLRLPYFWDEVGQFIPATWDIFSHGAFIPHSATPNVHPPAVMTYVALFWKFFGPWEVVSRSAMLVLASLTLLAAFLVAVELTAEAPGAPALLAVLLLAVSPLFFVQSLLVQLDLPAALFSLLALWLFIRERHVWATLACVLLVLSKETGVWVPLLFCGWLAYEKRWRRAAVYLLPLTVLGLWLLILRAATGSWFGNRDFEQYNLHHTLRLSHIAFALARRCYTLFIDQFNWVGTLVIVAAWRAGMFRRRRWKVAAAFTAGHVLIVSVLGGAVLDRYLLPVLPLFFIAASAGIERLRPGQRWGAILAMFAGLATSLFVNPWFWPFPYENNLAIVDFTSLHQQTAQYVEQHLDSAKIATPWPLSAELQNPRLGYVNRPHWVLESRDLTPRALRALPADQIDAFIWYSKDWDPPRNLIHQRLFRYVALKYLDYQEPASSEDVQKILKMRLVWQIEQGGQRVELYTR